MARRFAGFVLPPIAGAVCGWGLWGGAEYMWPQQMQSVAATVHGASYCAQLHAAKLLPNGMNSFPESFRIPAPLPSGAGADAQRAESDQGTMFSDIFEACRLSESLDWLEENVTDDIPFLYINELVAAFGTLYFWKHFLHAPVGKSAAAAEPSAAKTATKDADLKVMRERTDNDYGAAVVHVAGGDDELQVMPHRIDIYSGGEGALVEGLWHRFAVTRQLDPAAGWSALAVLTQEPRNAIALAAIALVAAEAPHQNHQPQQQQQPPSGGPVFGRSVMQVGNESVLLERGDRFNVLCSADRCVWALAALIDTGLGIWKADDNSGVAVLSPQHQQQQQQLAANQQPAGGGFLRSVLPAFLFGDAGAGGPQLAKRRPFLVSTHNAAHLEHVREVLAQMEQLAVQAEQDAHLRAARARGAVGDAVEAVAPYDRDGERRWAVAGMDPFLVTVRNVDAALCDFLRQGRERTHRAPDEPRQGWLRYVPFMGTVRGSSEELNKCVDLKRLPAAVGAEATPSATATSCGTVTRAEIDAVLFAKQQAQPVTLVPTVRRHFATTQRCGFKSHSLPHLFEELPGEQEEGKGKPAQPRWVLSDYIGEQFASAAESGHVPLSSQDDVAGSRDDSALASPAQLQAAARLVQQQADVMRAWVSE